jgi:hypothetical protein
MSKNEQSQDWGQEMDRSEHEETYVSFLNYSKYSLIAITVIMLALLVFVYN